MKLHALFALILLAGCATGPSPQDHRVALETRTAILANVPRDIAAARERGPAAVEKERHRSQRWLLGTGMCSKEDRDMLEKTLAECLNYRGTYAEAKEQFRSERWAYVAGVMAAPSLPETGICVKSPE